MLSIRGPRLHYFELLRMARYEDFEWKSRCPEPEFQFAWLANGFLEYEGGGTGKDKWLAHEHLILLRPPADYSCVAGTWIIPMTFCPNSHRSEDRMEAAADL